MVESPLSARPRLENKALKWCIQCRKSRAILWVFVRVNDLLVEARLAGRWEEEQAIDDRMGFLTPILKGFLSEVGTELANIGVQVYGGHGYVTSNGQVFQCRWLFRASSSIYVYYIYLYFSVDALFRASSS